MDKTDKKILTELMNNSRQPVAQLARKLKISREVANYRIKKLEEQGIIKEFTTEINAEKLGYTYASLFLTIKKIGEQKFKEYLRSCPFAAWTSEFAGIWNFGVGIYGKNLEEIHERFTLIYEQFKEDIIDHRLTPHRKTQQFYEKYIDLEVIEAKKEFTEYAIDDKDKELLKELAHDARKDTLALAKKIGLSAVATAKRIKQLEKTGHIQKYSVFIDPAKLGLYQFSVFIVNRKHHYDQIISHLKSHKSISFIIEYVGDPFLEFGIIVKDPFHMRRVLQEIEGSFPDNRIVETFLIQQEILSTGLPPCVFD